MLASFEDVQVIAEAIDGTEAIKKTAALSPDLVFLDIQMPEPNGLEVATTFTPPRPYVVFCTAYDRYAIDAFDLHAVDYLLKPINRARLARAVSRVRDSISGQSALERDLQAAGEVQARFYPKTLPLVSGLDYQACSRPARTVNGDYYDFLTVGEGKLAFALGDVSGKGIPAGLLMASLHARVQSHAPLRGDSVAELLAELNRLMCTPADSRHFVTFFYAVYDGASRRLTYSNAGHVPPLLLGRHRHEPIRLSNGGTVLGLMPDAHYEQAEVQLEPGDVLVCYTDGIIEALGPDGNEFGQQRVEDCIRRNLEFDAPRILEALMGEVSAFSSTSAQEDDQTALVAKVSP